MKAALPRCPVLAVSLFFLLGAVSSTASGSGSPELPPERKEAVPVPSPPQETFIDVERESLARLLSEAVAKFDNFFGDEYLEESARKPYTRFRGSVEWKERQKFVFKQRVRVVLPLPLLERRLHTFIGSDSEDDLRDDPDYLGPEDDEGAEAGLRYFFSDQQQRLKPAVSVGARLKMNPVVFLKPRLEWNVPLPPYFLKTTQYVYWYSDDGFGETTNFYVRRILGKRWQLGLTSEATYSETSSGLNLSEEFSIRYLDFSLRHSDHFAAALEWESDAHTWPAAKFDQHQLRLRLRHSVWRKWLRLEISPRLTWERQVPDDGGPGSEYWQHASPSLMFTLEILLEELS